MTIGLVGRKTGMTRVFTAEGQSLPVTVIEVEPNRITQMKTVESDGYRAVQVTAGHRKPQRRYANAGFSVRLGNDLRSDFGPPRIRPSLPGSAFFQPVDANGWYFFVGMDARYVDRNIFLEGDTPFASNIEREHWVGDLQAGFVFTRRTFRVAYTHVYRTEEFKQQAEPDRFGSLAFSWRF